MPAGEFLCTGRCTGGAGDKPDRITFALHAVHEVLAPRAHADDRGPYHRELASIICGLMLLFHFALGAMTLGRIRPDAAYDPACIQSNRTTQGSRDRSVRSAE